MNARPTPPMSYRLGRLSNHMRSVAERCERLGGEHWRDRGAKIRRYSHLATQWEIDAKFEEAQRGQGMTDPRMDVSRWGPCMCGADDCPRCRPETRDAPPDDDDDARYGLDDDDYRVQQGCEP